MNQPAAASVIASSISINGDAAGTFTPTASTDVVAVAELLPALESVVDDVTVAVFVIVVPLGVAAFTFTTIVKVAFAPLARVGSLQVSAPVPPTAGATHENPAGAVTDTNVVFAGVLS